MSFFQTTNTQRTLILLASIPVVVKSFVMYFYTGTNPLQGNVAYLLLLTVLTFSAIYVYYRITA